MTRRSCPRPYPLPQPSATPVAHARPVIRISTDMVQIDAVITDKQGHSVVDLRPEDFEVFQDGRKQNISHLRYVAAGPGWAWAAGKGVRTPTATSEAGEPRTFVFVIDNLGLSLEGTARARRLMQSFVTSGLQPRDRAAIIETSATVGGPLRTHFGSPRSSRRRRTGSITSSGAEPARLGSRPATSTRTAATPSS